MANQWVVGLGCLLLGGAAGWFLAHNVEGNPSRGTSLPQVPASDTQSARSRPAQKDASHDLDTTALSGSAGIPAVQSMADTAEITSEFLQSAALYALAAPMDGPGIRELLEESKQALTGGDYRGATSLLIGRYAELDFAAALDFALRFGGPDLEPWLSSIFHSRARIDVDDAVRVAAQLSGNQQRIAGVAILRSNQSLDTDQQQTIAAQLRVPDHMVIATQNSTAEAWLEAGTIKDPMQRSNIQARLLMKWARSDPWAALQASEEVVDNQMMQAIRGPLFALAAADDTQRALDWLRAQPDNPSNARLTVAAVGQLVQNDPAAAALLIDQLPEQYRAEAELSLWSRRASADPEGAARWLQELAETAANDPGKAAIMRRAPGQLVMTLGMASPAAAERLLDALPPEQRGPLETTYVQALAQQDPLRAADRLSNIADAQQRDSAAAHLVLNWGYRDLNGARRWVEQQSGGDAAKLYRSLGTAWVQHDVAAARDYAMNLNDTAARDQMLAGVLTSGRSVIDNADSLLDEISDPRLRREAEQMQEAIRRSLNRGLDGSATSSLRIVEGSR